MVVHEKSEMEVEWRWTGGGNNFWCLEGCFFIRLYQVINQTLANVLKKFQEIRMKLVGCRRKMKKLTQNIEIMFSLKNKENIAVWKIFNFPYTINFV